MTVGTSELLKISTIAHRHSQLVQGKQNKKKKRLVKDQGNETRTEAHAK